MSVTRLFFFVLTLLGVLCSTSKAYKIHAKSDTIYVHTKRGVLGQPSDLIVISSRDGEDTATINQQGWDTIRVSLSSDNQFYWQGAWAKKPIPFLTQRSLYLDYIPKSLAHSIAIVTVQGDSNTIRIVVIGIPDTNYQCLNVKGGSFPTVVEGQSGIGADTLYNLTDSVAIIDSIQKISDLNVFQVQGLTFPFTLPPHSSIPIPIRFTVPSPALSQTYMTNFRVWARGTSPDMVACGSALAFAGVLVSIPKDTFAVSLPINLNDTFDISVRSALSIHDLIVQNISGSRVILTDAGIPDTSASIQFQTGYGPHCRFRTCQGKCYCLNDTLDQNAYSDVIPVFIAASDTGTYIINVVLNYVGSTQPQSYILRVHYVRPFEAAVVRTQNQLQFAIHPNPAHNEAIISLPTEDRSTVEIYDVLGNLVHRTEAMGEMTWSPKEAGGVYIVRVSQHMANGSIATSSKRLVFER